MSPEMRQSDSAQPSPATRATQADTLLDRLEAARTIEREIERHQHELRSFEHQFAGLRTLRDELRGMVQDARTVAAGSGTSDLDRAVALVVTALSRNAAEGGSETQPAIEALAREVLVAALANVASHSGATESNFSIKREEHWLFISIFDNGSGSADPGRGASLRRIRERVDALGGHFSLSSPPGRGTLLTVGLPCT